MSTFQRARSEEQREVRRQAILETAATMLGEMSISAITLNELSRRVGLAKSNVLRYFESREAVLLEVLTQLAREFFTELAEQLPEVVDQTQPAHDRAATISSTVAASFATHPMLCELLSAQAGVLEHNVSTQTVAQYKRSGYRSLAGFAAGLRLALPELSDGEATEAARAVVILAGALWTHTHPPQAVVDAYEYDASLVFLPEGFAGALDRVVRLTLLGLLHD